MTTQTKRSKDAARPRPRNTTKPKPAPASAPGSATRSPASERLRKEARAAVAANLAALERAETGSAAPGFAPGPVAHNEQGGEPQEPQPDQQQRQQPDQQPAPGTATAMKAKAGAKNGAAKPKGEKATKPAKAPKPPKGPGVKRLSCIDAAAQIIGKDAIGCRDLIAEMGQQKLWSSPNGKTPEASLYAAVIREIAAKGAAARFKKVDRGLFIANTGAGKERARG